MFIYLPIDNKSYHSIYVFNCGRHELYPLNTIFSVLYVTFNDSTMQYFRSLEINHLA